MPRWRICLTLTQLPTLGTTAMMCCVTRSGNWTIALCGSVSASVIQASESYSELSELFDRVFFHYLRHIHHTTKYIGGQSFYGVTQVTVMGNCHWKQYLWRNNGRLGDAAKVYLRRGCFKFPPELLNKLAPSRWRHWGKEVIVGRLDYPIHDSIYLAQRLVKRVAVWRAPDLSARHRTQSQAGQALTLPELFDTPQMASDGGIATGEID